jgi:dTDP-4-dehydrorhamnose reductase
MARLERLSTRGLSRDSEMKVLVTGAAGLLGGRLAEQLATRFSVVAARHRQAVPPGLAEVTLDLDDPLGIDRAFRRVAPAAVVHCAAIADPDRCEAEPSRAESLNVRAAERLAETCRRGGVRLISLSTDLVLPGDRPCSDERVPPRPVSVYARTKQQGEAAVLSGAPGSAVVRVALVHGLGFGGRATASEAIAWALRAGRALRLFTDQHRTPVDPESVASALSCLLEGSASGLFHVGGAERLSRFELGLRVARALGLPADLISPASQAAAAGAPRPADVSLDSGRARRELGYLPRPLDDGIRDGRLSAREA